MVSCTLPTVLPPTTNRGVTFSPPIDFVKDSTGAVVCRFDYYRASVDADLERVLDCVRRAVGVEFCDGRGMFSYERGVNFVTEDTVRASVFWSVGGSPLVQASGVFAQRVYESIASVGVERLRLARADVCLDGASGLFESVDSVLHEVALAGNVASSLRGDWDTPGSPSGRTRYVGVRESFRFRRLYEFFKCHGYGSPWRYELEVKPTSGYKSAYGAMDPIDVLRADGFSRRVLHRLGLDLSRLVVSLESVDVEPDTTFDSLARQYWKVLSAACEQRGGDLELLGRDLMSAVEKVREKRLRASV